jgi:hypothetical protein
VECRGDLGDLLGVTTEAEVAGYDLALAVRQVRDGVVDKMGLFPVDRLELGIARRCVGDD